MGAKKALFFDIDGTIMDFKRNGPGSTVRAIRELRKNGHIVFINSGRARGFIRDPKVLDIGFNGIISGCGTMIEYNGEIVMYRELDNDLLAYTVNICTEHRMRPILEGKKHLYLKYSDFKDDIFGSRVIEELGSDLRDLTDYWGNWEASKLSCAVDAPTIEECRKKLSDYFDFIVHNEKVIEIIPKDSGKGTGIRKVCELLDIDIADTFAFGDGKNDLDMFHAAGVAVAMGNANEDAKKAADYITDDINDDGIFNACRHFELI